MTILQRFLLWALAFIPALSFSQSTPLYKDKTKPVSIRVSDLLGRMTPEEKFWQLFMIPGDLENASPGQYKNGIFGLQVSASGKKNPNDQLLNYQTNESANALAKKINAIQKYFVENTRLGIPIIPFDEALHGLVRDGATVFPQAIGMAATWDTSTMHKVATIIAEETKQRGIRQVLSPVVNLATDVRWGRTEETYGEDPFLAAAMGVSFVIALENKGIITTPKHFIANAGDGGRDSYPVDISERLLDETYFIPFSACFREGHSRSVMTAYNSLNGQACSANQWLLQKKLKKQWGFDGFVISDANAVGGEVVLHHTAKDYAESGAHAINNGLDVIFQTDYDHYKLFQPAFLDGRIDSNRINDAVSRVLKAKFELGLFENPYIDTTVESINNKEKKQVALDAARKSIVLLKNKNKILPLKKNLASIAIIGTDAKEARMGGYSGPGNEIVSIFEGIKNKIAANTKLLYAAGCGRSSEEEEYTVIPPAQLSFQGLKGLRGYYFNNITLAGNPSKIRIDNQLDFRWTLYPPDAALEPELYAARWEGKLLAPSTGKFKIGLEGNDGYRLFIDNKLVIDNWKKESYHAMLVDYFFEKNKSYDIRVEFFETTGNATIKLIWNAGITNDWKKKIDEAVRITRQSSLAIVCVGIEEGEFRDRALLSLPGHQEEMIRALTGTGKPVIVLLTGGSAVTMNSWIEKVPAIVETWYAGEEGGNAIADVLFGDYNPAGRLPITFPVHEGQLPLVYNHKPTGRGDDYNNLTGLPLFPFGFGLSYTSFQYSDMKIDKSRITLKDSATVSFTLKNTGVMEGEEVLQLYIKDKLSSFARPVMELKGFQRIHLKANESRQVHFTIYPELLGVPGPDLSVNIEPGEFLLMIGASSRDIRFKQTLTVTD